MPELPRGVWKWLAGNARDLARIALAVEKVAEELGRIRAALEDDDEGQGEGQGEGRKVAQAEPRTGVA